MEEYEQNFLDKVKKAKIIHNKQRYEGFSAQSGTLTYLLWPCMKYEIELQVQKEDIDIFEKTVLKLSQCQSPRTEDIAKSMGMEQATVEFVQERLVSKGLLKDRIYTLTEKGESVIQALSENKNVEQKIVCVFKDLLCGKILPYIDENPALNSHNGIFATKNGDDEKKDGGKKEKNDFMTRYNLPGNDTKTAHIVLPLKDLDFFGKPKSFQILRAIKEFNKICEKEQKIKINPASTAVEVKSQDFVLLNVLAFAREGSGEIICTDGGGFDVSDVFAEYITENSTCYPWVDQMFENGKAESKSKSEDEKQSGEKIHFAYKDISEPVLRCAKNLKNLEQGKKSSDESERKEDIREIEEIVYNIYTAFERSLQVYYRSYHNEKAEDAQIMLADTEARRINQEKLAEADFIEENMRFFYPLAEKLEFNISEEVKSLLKVYPGKIRGMRENQQAELVPLLCLALAQAVDDKNAPFLDLAKTKENILCELYTLKGFRDSTKMAHGPGLKQNSVSVPNLKNLCETMMSAMKILIPDLQNDFDKFKDLEIGTKTENLPATQKRFNMKVVLYKKFGLNRLNRLNSNLQNQLVELELTFESKRYLVGSCSSVIQQFFEATILSLIKRINPPEKEKRKSVFAEKKALECGFKLKNGKFSSSLQTVNYKKINNAVCGGGRDTLGAAVIAFLILCPKDELEDFAQKLPNAITEIENLLEKRKHADLKEYSEFEMSTLRKSTYCIIQELIDFI